MKDARVRVLLLVNSLGFGGAEKQTVTLFNTLDTRRFRLSLAWLKDETPLRRQIRDERAEGGVFCVGAGSRIDMQAARRLAAHLQEQQIDVVMCTNTYSLLYAWLARLCGPARPRIVEVFHSTEVGSLVAEMQMLFYRPWILASDCLVYVCENQRRYWRRRGLRAREDVVIYNGIDATHFADHSSREAKEKWRADHGFGRDDYVIGLCAAMRPEKAHTDLIAALAQLRARGVPARALLIGDGHERTAIEAAIRAHGLQSDVRITGFCSDVRPLIAMCDTMAITSHSVETFSIAALEAMALGKPMIMTEIGGAAEQVQSGINGVLYPRGDIDALCNALHALHEPALRTRMGQAARARVVQHFSEERMVEAYARLFENLASGKGATGITPAEPRHAA